jgi:hypothetical protein
MTSGPTALLIHQFICSSVQSLALVSNIRKVNRSVALERLERFERSEAIEPAYFFSSSNRALA